MKKILILAAMLAALTACEKTVCKTFHLTGFPNLEITYDGGYTLFGIEANEDDRWTLTAPTGSQSISLSVTEMPRTVMMTQCS